MHRKSKSTDGANKGWERFAKLFASPMWPEEFTENRNTRVRMVKKAESKS